MSRFSQIRKSRGSVSIALIFSTIAIWVALLGGVDLMRWSMVEAKVQDALDGATLAGGNDLNNLPSSPSAAQLATWKAYITGYFNANMPSGYLSSTMGALRITLNTSAASGTTPASSTVSVSTSGSIPLLVAGYLGSAPLAVAGSSQVLVQNQNNLELALVLDNTGSMSETASGSGFGQTKMQALQAAATTLVNNLIPSSSTSTSGASVYIGLVPFTTVVNVRDANGNKPNGWLTTSALDAGGNALPATAPFSSVSNWNGCLAEPKPLTQPLSLLSPAKQPFRAYFDGWQTQYFWSAYYSNFTQYFCPAQSTTFLTANTSTLINSINHMTASGSTFIASGIMWGWRMLAPSWRNANANQGWGNANLPQDASTSLTKAMIIITDGANEWQLPSSQFSIANLASTYYNAGNYTSPWYGGLGQASTTDMFGWNYFYLADFSGSFVPSLQPFGAINDWYGDNSSALVEDAMEINACQQAEAAGIKIWAIIYGNDSSTAHSLAVMQQCVNEQAFYAPSDTALQADFKSITAQLNTLRITH